MTNERILKAWEYSYIYALKKGLSDEDAKDAAQEISSKIAMGRKASIEHIFIDYLRKDFGDPRSNSYSNRLAGHKKYESLDSHEGLQSTSPRDRDNLNYCAGLLNGKDRIIFVLYYGWGLHEVEVGNLYKVSESRVSQWLKGIQKRLSARVKKEAKCKTQRKNTMAKVLSKKETRDEWKMERKEDIRVAKKASFEMASFDEKSVSQWTSSEVLCKTQRAC